MTEPYILRNPGDAIVAEDWNKIQVLTREEIHSHDHTGDARGVKLGGSAIDPATSVTVAKLTTATLQAGQAPGNPASLALGVDGRAEFRFGEGNWRRLVVTTTAEWGDGDTFQFVTLGAGGANGIMLSSPHVTWRDNRASIRYGRTGGMPGQTYWDAGVRPDGSFSFLPVDGGANGQEKLKIGRAGEVTIAGPLTVGPTTVNGPVNIAGSLSVAGLDIRATLLNHNHTGGTQGARLDGGAIDPKSSLTVAKLTAPSAQLGVAPGSPNNLALVLDGRAEFRPGDSDNVWRRLVITTTAEWGDGDANQYITLGSGGAAGIMLSNPHVTWRDGKSSIRYGRTGGAYGGTYWDAGVRGDGSFSLISTDGGADGSEKLKVARNGFVGIGTGAAAPAARLQVKNGAIMPEVGNSQAAGIWFPPDPGGGGGDGAFLRYHVESGETTTLRLGINNDADDSLRLFHAGYDRLILQNGQVTVSTGPFTGPNSRWLNVEGEIKSFGTNAGVRFVDRDAPLTDAREWVIHVTGDRMYFWRGANGNHTWIAANGVGQISDLRRKRDVTDFGSGLDTILKLRGVRFRWKGEDDDSPQIGVIAQEVEEHLPELVSEGPDGQKGVTYAGLIAPMIEAIKEQQAQIEALRRELGDLRAGGRADNL